MDRAERSRWGAGVVALLSVLLIVGAAYLPSRGAGFFWDDLLLLRQNSVVLERQWWRAVAEPLWSGVSQNGGTAPYWRPGVMVSFLLDQGWFGADPAGWHLHSVLWHLAAVAALYALVARRLGWGPGVAAAAVFGLHPVQSESVMWIAARNDLMCAAGIFLALLGLDIGGRRGAAVAVVGGCVAMSTKEIALALPGIALAWRLAWGERPRWGQLAGVGAMVAGFWALRQAVLPPIDVPAQLVDSPLWSRLPFVAGTYLSWLVVPWPLTSTASLYLPSLPGWRWAAAALALALGGAILSQRPRLTGGLLLLGLLSVTPSLLSMAASRLMGERFLYLPLGFLSIALAAAVSSISEGAAERQRILAAAGALVGVGWLVVLGARLPDWASEAQMVEAALASQDDAYTWSRQGAVLYSQGQLKESFAAFQQALDRQPFFPPACAPPISLLRTVGAAEQAAALARTIGPRGCTASKEYDAENVRALVGVAAWGEAATALQGRPKEAFEVLRVEALAVAVALGDWTLAMRLAQIGPEPPSALRAEAEALVRMRRAAGEPAAAPAAGGGR